MATPDAKVIRPLRRVEYYQLVELGAFQDERIELLEGELVAMSPIGKPHNWAVPELTELLVLCTLAQASPNVGSSICAKAALRCTANPRPKATPACSATSPANRSR